MISDLLKYAEILKKSGIENYWKEVRILTAHELGLDYKDILLGDFVINDSQAEAIGKLVLRRSLREPIAKIIGKANFYDFEFITTKDTLDPRPESEFIIASVLKYFHDKDSKLSFLDIGTGTGCLVLTCLLEYKKAFGVGVDISEKAIAVAEQNAGKYCLTERVDFVLSDWLDKVQGRFDVILCNPPYISETAELEEDVKFDPHQALFADDNGLGCYKKIFQSIKNNTNGKTLMFFEVGMGQSDDVVKIAEEYGVALVEIVKDLQNIERVLVLK